LTQPENWIFGGLMHCRHDNARNEEDHTPMKFMYSAVITVTTEMWRSVICIVITALSVVQIIQGQAFE